VICQTSRNVSLSGQSKQRSSEGIYSLNRLPGKPEPNRYLRCVSEASG